MARRDRRPRPDLDPEVPGAARDPAPDAGQRQAPRGKGAGSRLLPDRRARVPPANLAGEHGAEADQGLGLRLGRSPRHLQLPGVHDRGDLRHPGASQVDQRPGEAEWRVPAAPAADRPDASLGEPARRRSSSRPARQRSRPLPGASPDRDPPSRRPHQRGERRLPRGLVPTRCAQHPGGLREDWLPLPKVPGPGPARPRPGVDARQRHFSVRQRDARAHRVVPRPRPWDHPRQCLCGPGGLLLAAGRSRRRGRRNPARSARRATATRPISRSRS